MNKELEKLTYDQIVALHLEIESGEEITFSEKRLQSNIEFLNQFDDLGYYAIQLLCTMIFDNIFENYNRETALVSLEYFLTHNGYTLDFDNEIERNKISDIIKTINESKQLNEQLKDLREELLECVHPISE